MRRVEPGVTTIDLPIIVPTYRGAAALPLLVERLEEALRSTDVDTAELILVNDGSPDDTEQVITELERRHPWVHGMTPAAQPRAARGHDVRAGPLPRSALRRSPGGHDQLHPGVDPSPAGHELVRRRGRAAGVRRRRHCPGASAHGRRHATGLGVGLPGRHVLRGDDPGPDRPGRTVHPRDRPRGARLAAMVGAGDTPALVDDSGPSPRHSHDTDRCQLPGGPTAVRPTGTRWMPRVSSDASRARRAPRKVAAPRRARGSPRRATENRLRSTSLRSAPPTRSTDRCPTHRISVS